MEENMEVPIDLKEGNKNTDIIYRAEKDFYKGVGGEFRLKAEGLFKKAKEKGISIEEISIITLKENREEFPGLGVVELPTFVVQVKGRHMESGQVIIDGKQIDYFNRYKKYLAEKLEYKNSQKDEKGRKIREYGRIKPKEEIEFTFTDWERFQIAKSLIEDKEFGLEKTITGACDRVIRKLMGENDWLYPEEARLLDEEYNSVQSRIVSEQEEKKTETPPVKKATERQINYFKAKLKNMGVDTENPAVIEEVLKEAGYKGKDVEELSTIDMSRLIDNISSIVMKVKEGESKRRLYEGYKPEMPVQEHEGMRQ